MLFCYSFQSATVDHFLIKDNCHLKESGFLHVVCQILFQLPLSMTLLSDLTLLKNHGLIFTGLPASRVPRFAPLLEFALAAWARQFELFTSGLTSQHGAGHRCDSCGKLNVYFVVQFTF